MSSFRLPHCSCLKFIQLYRGSITCATCLHDNSQHSEPHSDEEASSNNEKTHVPYEKGTRTYIKCLQNEASAAAITEAISETRHGFRPQRTKKPRLPSTTSSSSKPRSLAKGKERTTSQKRKANTSSSTSDNEDSAAGPAAKFKASNIVILPHGIEGLKRAAVPSAGDLPSWVAAGLAAQGSFEVNLSWGTNEVTAFLRTTLPQIFEYFNGTTGNQQYRSNSLLKIWPYAVIERHGKVFTVVNTFHPTGKTLRNSLHGGGITLRRAVKMRTIYLVTRDPVRQSILEDMFKANPTACPVVQSSTPPSDNEMLEGPSSKPYKGKGKAKRLPPSPDPIEVDDPSDNNMHETENSGIMGIIRSSQEGIVNTPSFPTSPKRKKAKLSVQDPTPTLPQKLGTVDIVTALRADTSFDENIWS